MASNTASVISEGERAFVNQLLSERQDQCCLIEWATKLRRQKVQKRLLVVGTYRVYSIKRSKNGKKTLQRDGPILELKTLELTDNPDEIVLYWQDFNIHVLTPNAYNVAQLVRFNFQNFSCGFPEEFQIQLKVNDPSRLAELPPPEYSPAGGFRLTYKARCNQLLVVPHEPLIEYVEDLGNAGERVLNLNYVAGIETMDLRPLTLALMHNIWFVGLLLSDVVKPNALSEFSQLIAVNRTLVELAVDGTAPTKGSVSLLGDCMLKNPHPALEVVNLRGIKISDDESLKFGLGLAGYKHFLTGLDVTGCGLTGRSVTGVFAGLAANKNMTTYLRVFKVGRNKLGGGQGTVELARFFDRFAIGNEPRSLEELNLSDCNLDAVVISALVRRDGVVATLKEIDLSHNVLSGSIGASLTAMAKDSQCLRRINISNTRVDVDTVESFLKALAANEFLDSLEIDLSHNLLKMHGADAIDRGLRGAGALAKIRSLNLYNCGLSEEGLSVLVKVFEPSPSLEELDIGANIVKSRGGPQLQNFLTMLSVFVTKNQKLRVLRMAGQVAGKLYLGKYMGPFLAVFASTRSIEELDISGNQIGDEGIEMLAEALRMNKTLKSLYWDDNGTTPISWASLVRALKENFTLVHAQYPAADITAFAPRGKRGERQRLQAETLMGDLSKILNRNQSGGGPEVVSQLRIRGQTFAQSYLVDQSNYQRSQDMTSPQMYKPMAAPPPLAQAFPSGAPLDRQREEQMRQEQMRLQQEQQLQQQQQQQRQYAPPPSMAQFQAQRAGQVPPAGYGAPAVRAPMGQPQPMAQPPKQYQPPPQQQYYQQQPPPQQRFAAPPIQQQQHQHYEYADESEILDLPPPPPVDEFGYTSEMQTYGDYSDLPEPPQDWDGQ